MVVLLLSVQLQVAEECGGLVCRGCMRTSMCFTMLDAVRLLMQRSAVLMLMLSFPLLQANGLGWYPEFNKVGLPFEGGGGAAEGMRVELTQS